jgi:hypothetical protein
LWEGIGGYCLTWNYEATAQLANLTPKWPLMFYAGHRGLCARRRRGMTKPPKLPEGYAQLLAGLKQRIVNARLQASLAVNKELVLLYWSIGRDILARQQAEGWEPRS